MGIQRLNAAGEVHLLEHMPEEGIEFREVGNVQDADFVVSRRDLNQLNDEPDATFFWPYMVEKIWFLRPDFLGQQPRQQWRMRIGKLAFDVYDFMQSPQIERTDLLRMAGGVATVDAHFPISVPTAPHVIAIIDRFRPQVESSRSYSCMASVHVGSGVMTLGVRGGAFDNSPYSEIISLPARDAAPIHEAVHFGLDTKLSQPWRDAGFSWRPIRTSLRGLHKIEEGSRAYRANQPGACVTAYGKTAESEDIPDSVVAYLGGAKNKLHPAKHKILKENDYDLQPLRPKLRKVVPVMSMLPSILHYVAADIKPQNI